MSAEELERKIQIELEEEKDETASAVKEPIQQPDEETPVCMYDAQCTRKNLQHLIGERNQIGADFAKIFVTRPKIYKHPRYPLPPLHKNQKKSWSSTKKEKMMRPFKK
jgi:hypothetical protein